MESTSKFGRRGLEYIKEELKESVLEMREGVITRPLMDIASMLYMGRISEEISDYGKWKEIVEDVWEGLKKVSGDLEIKTSKLTSYEQIESKIEHYESLEKVVGSKIIEDATTGKFEKESLASKLAQGEYKEKMTTYLTEIAKEIRSIYTRVVEAGKREGLI